MAKILSLNENRGATGQAFHHHRFGDERVFVTLDIDSQFGIF